MESDDADNNGAKGFDTTENRSAKKAAKSKTSKSKSVNKKKRRKLKD